MSWTSTEILDKMWKTDLTEAGGSGGERKLKYFIFGNSQLHLPSSLNIAVILSLNLLPIPTLLLLPLNYSLS